MTELLTDKKRGVTYQLKDGHTVESIREDAQHYEDHGSPFVCRHKWAGGHDWKEVGEPWHPNEDESDLMTRVLMVLTSCDVDSLQRCARCRRVITRSRW